MLFGLLTVHPSVVLPTQDGTIVSITVSAIICVVWTLISPEKDKNAWARFKGIEVEDNESVRARIGSPGLLLWVPAA